jgi:hypothetical protein
MKVVTKEPRMVLDYGDYRTLVEARAVLKRLADDQSAIGDRADGCDGFRQGVIYQAAVEAEWAVFQTLNVLGNYGADPEANRVIHMREYEAPPCR